MSEKTSRCGRCCPVPDPGPCPPLKPDDPCVVCPGISRGYAYFSQNNRLYNSALYGGIRLENPPIQTEGIHYDTGIVSILKPGSYLITYMVHFPEDSTVDTTLEIQIDNRAVTGTVCNVRKSLTGIPYTAAAQVIYHVENYVTLRLSSSKVVDITASPDSTVASLSILEL